MRRAVATGVTLAVLLIAGGCGGADDTTSATATTRALRGPTAAEQVQRMALGASVFAEHCQRCHALFGRGGNDPDHPGDQPSFDHVKPTLAEIRNRIDRGGMGMAMFDRALSEREERALALYVFHTAGERVKVPHEGEVDAAQLARGERVFRANCQACHQIDGRPATGRPTFPGTNFDVVRPSTRLVLKRAHEGMGVWMPAFRGRVSDEALQDVATYVNALAVDGVRPAP